MTTRTPILIVGSMAFDDLELPAGNFPNTVGGSATYASFAASSFTEVRPVAIVGSDFPTVVLEELRLRGVQTEGIERAEGKTFRWAGRYDTEFGRVTLDTQLNVFADFRPKLAEGHRCCSIVLLGNIHPALQAEVLDAMSGPDTVVADTMNFWIQREPKALEQLLKRVDVLIINDEEARELSGIHNIRRAAHDIRKRGPHSLIIKRGEHGALLFDDAGIFAMPGFPLEDIVDPTGAGDTFAGGFVGHLATRVPPGSKPDTGGLRRAMLYGTATASCCVEGVGTSKVQTLTSGDIEARVSQIRALFELPAD